MVSPETAAAMAAQGLLNCFPGPTCSTCPEGGGAGVGLGLGLGLGEGDGDGEGLGVGVGVGDGLGVGDGVGLGVGVGVGEGELVPLKLMTEVCGGPPAEPAEAK